MTIEPIIQNNNLFLYSDIGDNFGLYIDEYEIDKKCIGRISSLKTHMAQLMVKDDDWEIEQKRNQVTKFYKKDGKSTRQKVSFKLDINQLANKNLTYDFFILFFKFKATAPVNIIIEKTENGQTTSIFEGKFEENDVLIEFLIDLKAEYSVVLRPIIDIEIFYFTKCVLRLVENYFLNKIRIAPPKISHEGDIFSIVPSTLSENLGSRDVILAERTETGEKTKKIGTFDFDVLPIELKSNNVQVQRPLKTYETFYFNNQKIEQSNGKFSIPAIIDGRNHLVQIYSALGIFKIAELAWFAPTKYFLGEHIGGSRKLNLFSQFDNYLELITKNKPSKKSTELISFLMGNLSFEDFMNNNKLFYQVGNVNSKINVIVPVYNNIEITARCLATLALSGRQEDFFVTLVDDASSEDIEILTKKFNSINFVKNKNNLGFISSINIGFESKGSDFAIFLNNDVEVSHGWLDELMYVFNNFSDAVVVGSTLLYPDGSLQESGGVIWKKGVAWNYGRNENPHNAKYCFTRKTDYVSGACLMIVSSEFKKVGMLSEYLKPAYFDDVDLALKVSTNIVGSSVYVCAKSKVFHLEGQTNGNDISGGIKKHQRLNQPKFSEKWGPLFKFRPHPSFAYLDQLAEIGYSKRVLILDYIIPDLNMDAGGYAAINEMKIFRELGFKVDFLPANLEKRAKKTYALEREGIKIITSPEIYSVEQYLKQNITRYDVIYILRYTTALPLLDILKTRGKTKFIFNNVDLHYLRELRMIDTSGKSIDFVKKMQKHELSVFEEADIGFCYTEVEKNIISAQLLDFDKIKIMPWVARNISDNPLGNISGKIAFLGSFHHTPNKSAVEFIKEILAKEIPEHHFKVGGFGWPAEKSANYENVGTIADLDDFFIGCSILIVPLISGAGIKGKIFEALSRGIPVIATPIAAEGVNIEKWNMGYVCELENMKFKILELLSLKKVYVEMSKNCLSYCKTYISFENALEKVKDNIDV